MSFKVAIGLTMIVIGLLHYRFKRRTLMPGILMGIIFIVIGITATSFYYGSPLNFEMESIIPNSILGFGIGFFSSSFFTSRKSDDKFAVIKNIEPKKFLLPLFFLILFYFLNILPGFSGFFALLIVTGGFFIVVSILDHDLFKKGLIIGATVLILAFLVASFVQPELSIPRNDSELVDVLGTKVWNLYLEHIFFYFYHGACIGVFWDYVTKPNLKA